MTKFKDVLRVGNRFTFGIMTRKPWRIVTGYMRYFGDMRKYRKLAPGEVYFAGLEPVLNEWTPTTVVGSCYFYQDTWAAGHIFHRKPKRHVDVGSTALLVGILSQALPTISVDIRPVDAHLPGLEVVAGDVCHMPFPDDSVESLSSLCVIEHIGLGRYGDALDPQGTDKAAAELSRVLAPGGDLYVSVPIAPVTRTRFNGQRDFTVDDFVAKFPTLTLREIKFANDHGVYPESALPTLGKVVFGLFHFTKEKGE